LGLGVNEPTPAWGLMLSGAAVEFVQRAPWMAIVPGFAISLTVLAFNILGDSLRDALDPKLRTQTRDRQVRHVQADIVRCPQRADVTFF
jgi:peptide/nickel transport system permease protein